MRVETFLMTLMHQNEFVDFSRTSVTKLFMVTGPFTFSAIFGLNFRLILHRGINLTFCALHPTSGWVGNFNFERIYKWPLRSKL